MKVYKAGAIQFYEVSGCQPAIERENCKSEDSFLLQTIIIKNQPCHIKMDPAT